MADKDRPFGTGLTSWHLYLQALLTGTGHSGHVTLGAGWPTRQLCLGPAVLLHFLHSQGNQSRREQTERCWVHCVETDRHTRHEGEVISLRKILIKMTTSISSIVVFFSSSSLVQCQWKAGEEPQKESWPWLGSRDNTAQGPGNGKPPAMGTDDPPAARPERKGHKWKVQSKMKGAEGHTGWGLVQTPTPVTLQIEGIWEREQKVCPFHSGGSFSVRSQHCESSVHCSSRKGPKCRSQRRRICPLFSFYPRSHTKKQVKTQ